jgi:hypothetical protein
MTCEVDAKSFFPFSSFHVYNKTAIRRQRVVSTVVPLKEAEITFLANPSLMLLATSIELRLTLLTNPSGKVILIIV